MYETGRAGGATAVVNLDRELLARLERTSPQAAEALRSINRRLREAEVAYAQGLVDSGRDMVKEVADLVRQVGDIRARTDLDAAGKLAAVQALLDRWTQR